MGKIGIALDLGTSGFRGQALDLDRDGAILSTAVTPRHPLPGANVIDHLHIALEVGRDWAHQVIISAVNQVISRLGIEPDAVERLAVCGNPIQLSLFENIEIRDLAYAGKRKLTALGVVPPKRDGRIVWARDIEGLDLPSQTRVLIPPAVRHEIGADALAMMLQTGMLDRDEIAITTDYGTNAEMALLFNGTVFTGSTAAGPALEGQQIEDGLLALPGAICDVRFEPSGGRQFGAAPKGAFKTLVLDREMMPCPGDTCDPATGGRIGRGGACAVGITGTGVVALIAEGIRAGLIRIPKITVPGGMICLPNGLKFTEKDLLEAGKAIGSVRSGHITLCAEAGIRLEDIETAYMSGASGTYVDALKAQEIGMIPPAVRKIYQVGNTSLAMARDMVRDENNLERMKAMADDLRRSHCMFAASKVFEKVYILELSHWTEGMTLAQYQKFLKRYKLPPLTEIVSTPRVIKTVARDIPDLGPGGLKMLSDPGRKRCIVFEGCLGDGACVGECPESALTMTEASGDFEVGIDLSLCNGIACRRCERVCSEKVFDLVRLVTSQDGSEA